MQLSIIIVNYNVKYFLEHCLLSIIKSCKNIEAEILVVDNNSTDGSKVYLSSKFSTVRFFWNKENKGFGEANNEALQFANGEYILFLNPDTIVGEDCLEKCLTFFEENKDCGALGVRMIDGAGNFLKESKRSLPTPSAGFYKMIGLATLFTSSKIFAKYYAGNIPENENNIVDVLAGAFMMLSKKAVEITNGFDESFFMYGEDIDLSYRIQKAGLQNYYMGQNTIIHFKGESTQKKSANYVKHFYGAIKLFVNKHYSKKPLQAFLMKRFIDIGKNAAFIKNCFTFLHTTTSIKFLNTIFVGNSFQQEKISPALKNYDFIIISNNTIKEKLLEEVIQLNIDALILCDDYLSLKEIIELLPKMPKNILSMFYQNNAGCIIGSNDKNEKGIFIVV